MPLIVKNSVSRYIQTSTGAGIGVTPWQVPATGRLFGVSISISCLTNGPTDFAVGWLSATNFTAIGQIVSTTDGILAAVYVNVGQASAVGLISANQIIYTPLNFRVNAGQVVYGIVGTGTTASMYMIIQFQHD
jgi:hypothetical protein